MLTIKYQGAFKKDFRRIQRCEYDICLLEKVIHILANGEQLLPNYKDHALIGGYCDCRECHIAPDWSLVYKIAEEEVALYLIRTGMHSDIFLSP